MTEEQNVSRVTQEHIPQSSDLQDAITVVRVTINQMKGQVNVLFAIQEHIPSILHQSNARTAVQVIINQM